MDDDEANELAMRVPEQLKLLNNLRVRAGDTNRKSFVG